VVLSAGVVVVVVAGVRVGGSVLNPVPVGPAATAVGNDRAAGGNDGEAFPLPLPPLPRDDGTENGSGVGWVIWKPGREAGAEVGKSCNGCGGEEEEEGGAAPDASVVFHSCAADSVDEQAATK